MELLAGHAMELLAGAEAAAAKKEHATAVTVEAAPTRAKAKTIALRNAEIEEYWKAKAIPLKDREDENVDTQGEQYGSSSARRQPSIISTISEEDSDDIAETEEPNRRS